MEPGWEFVTEREFEWVKALRNICAVCHSCVHCTGLWDIVTLRLASTLVTIPVHRAESFWRSWQSLTWWINLLYVGNWDAYSRVRTAVTLFRACSVEMNLKIHLHFFFLLLLLLLLLLQALNILVESFGLLNHLFPFPSILDAGCPVFDLHLANVLFDVILPSVLGSSLWSFG